MSTIDPSMALPSAATSGSSSSSTPAQAFGTQNDFMKLFVAQLQAQDPLNPQSGADFVAQLAQFSSLEQQTNTNSQLTQILSSQDASTRATLASMVGKTVSAKVSSLNFAASPSGQVGLGVHLDAAVKDVTINISDASGRVVKSIDLGSKASGDYDAVWNGTNTAGVPLAPGTYSVAVSAKAADGSDVSSWATLHGQVTSLQFSQSGTQFRVGTNIVAAGDVTSVAQ